MATIDKTAQTIAATLTPNISDIFVKSFGKIAESFQAELDNANKALDYAQGENEKSFNRIVELNDRISELEKTIEHLKASTPKDAPKADAPKKRTKKYGKDAIRHSEYEDIKDTLLEGDHVFLAGPAGCGKSQLAEMLAEDMGLEFYISSQVTQEYKIEGYQDANGILHSTPFIEAFTKGGIFVLEEADASSSDVLVVLNTALANGYMSIPSMGLVHAHKNFHCIATGNTFGTGADDIYVGRNPLDASTLDRFGFFELDYDERIEMQCSGNNKEMVEFVHDLRNAIEKSGAHIMFPISYRGINKLAKYENKKNWNLNKAMRRFLIKGLDADNISIIGMQMQTFTNRYTREFKQIGRNMKKVAA